jgi:hypothetical protein
MDKKDETPVEIRDLLWKSVQSGGIATHFEDAHNKAVLEAFRRGQKSK